MHPGSTSPTIRNLTITLASIDASKQKVSICCVGETERPHKVLDCPALAQRSIFCLLDRQIQRTLVSSGPYVYGASECKNPAWHSYTAML